MIQCLQKFKYKNRLQLFLRSILANEFIKNELCLYVYKMDYSPIIEAITKIQVVVNGNQNWLLSTKIARKITFQLIYS